MQCDQHISVCKKTKQKDKCFQKEFLSITEENKKNTSKSNKSSNLKMNRPQTYYVYKIKTFVKNKPLYMTSADLSSHAQKS